MIATTAPLPAAAQALAELLPSASPLRVQPGQGPIPEQYAKSAIAASFVGTVSADVAVALVDRAPLLEAAGADAPLVAADVLQPALEHAVAVLGAGVLGDVREDDATALFAHPGTAVFELATEAGPAGWFAIRLREQAADPGRNLEASALGAGRLSRISNVEMLLTVEIGRTRMPVRDVLSLEPGAVIELDRSAGAPADVLLNGRLIAHGEVVVVDQDYAVRITKILDFAENPG